MVWRSAADSIRPINIFSSSLKVGWILWNLQLAHCKLKSSKFMSVNSTDSFSKYSNYLSVTFFIFDEWIHKTFKFSLIANIYFPIFMNIYFSGISSNPFSWILNDLMGAFSSQHKRMISITYLTKLHRTVSLSKIP